MMQPQQPCTLRTLCLLLLLICASASEDFDWTKSERSAFYYGTFPTGRQEWHKVFMF